MAGDYGRRLMPTVLRHEAKANPERTFAIHAKSDELNDGFGHVSFQQLARAVNYTSNWLQERFNNGQKPEPQDTLTYIGIPDLRYNILFYAAIQCRYKVFLPSPRNPVAVNLSLLEQIQCSKLIHSAEVAPVAKALQAAASGLKCEQLPSLSELLSAPDSEYIYDVQYDDVCNDPILILHSSGSTGLPKPVINTHGTFATYDVRDWPTVPGRRNHDGLSTLRFSEPDSRIYDVFPPFHIAGFLSKVMVPVYNLSIPVFGPSLRPPSGALAAEIIRQHMPRAVFLPPTITDQLYHEPGGPELLKQIDLLLYGGGPLPQAVGDKISKHTTLCQFYGSTEAGGIRQLIPFAEDWSYLEFHPNESYEMQPAEDGMFELVLLTNKSIERTSSLYHNYPDISVWHTKDLFVPHPTKPRLWKFFARKDDILVFSSGEKLNPIPMESCVIAVEGVSGALVVGNRQPQAALLVELSPSAKFSSDPAQDLWPTIEQGNALLPAHGRIAKSMIIIARSDKPFARAGKGTIVRRLTEDLYRNEIESLYSQTAAPSAPEPIAFKPSTFGLRDVKGLLRSVLAASAVAGEMRDIDNFYIYGMDSVKTLEVVGKLRASLRPYASSGDLGWLSVELVYRNPTVEQMSNILLDYLNNGTLPTKRNREAEIRDMVAKYVVDLPTKTESAQDDSTVSTGRLSVAITGTTGYFGSFIINELVKKKTIDRIYCLNRSKTAAETFAKRFPEPSPKVEFLHVNLSAPKLGLADVQYAALQQNCNAIIHNAWRVDFNLSLASFADNLDSVKNLIELSVDTTHHARILYISSISATGVWSPAGVPKQTVPEAMVENLDAPMDIGYAESKYVAERMLDTAAKQAGVPVSILRLGLISPSTRPEDKDTWPAGDSVRVYLETCKALGVHASDFVEVLDWVSVDWAATIVGEILHADVRIRATEHAPARVYNLVHAKPMPWSTVMGAVQAWCGGGRERRTVSLREWVELLKQEKADDDDAATLERLPALRMMPIFELMAKRGAWHSYAQEELSAASESLARYPAIDEGLMKMWLGNL